MKLKSWAISGLLCAAFSATGAVAAEFAPLNTDAQPNTELNTDHRDLAAAHQRIDAEIEASESALNLMSDLYQYKVKCRNTFNEVNGPIQTYLKVYLGDENKLENIELLTLEEITDFKTDIKEFRGWLRDSNAKCRL